MLPQHVWDVLYSYTREAKLSMVFHKWLHKLDKNKEELYAVVRTEKASLMWVIFQLPSYKNRAIQLEERTEAATAQQQHADTLDG